MFNPLTTRIKALAVKYPDQVAELEAILQGKTKVYIDYANVRPWSNKLQWHIDPNRVRQLFRSFDNVQDVRIYLGTLVGDADSEKLVRDLGHGNLSVITKPVKIIRKSIDVSSIPSTATDILKEFIRKSLLKKLKVETVEYLNTQLKELNQQGVFYIQDLKCNFDVEIGLDMMLDLERTDTETYILWSGDSDFTGPLGSLLNQRKNVILFSTARRVSSELNDLQSRGLKIYDIQKIRDFICWSREIQP